VAVDATETPLTVALDGVSVVVEGSAARLSVDSTDDTLSLAYDANESLTVTARNVSFAAGTDVAATDGAGSRLTTATVSEDRTLRLVLPPGTANVALTVDQSGESGGGGDRSDGRSPDSGGDDQSTPDRTDRDTASVPGTETEPPAGPGTETTAAPSTTGGGGPGFGIGVALAGLLCGLAVGARRRSY
jgi:PGF-CTERM protein